MLPRDLSEYDEICESGDNDLWPGYMRELIKEVRRIEKQRDELVVLLDRARPQLICLHEMICHNLLGAAAEQVVHDLVADIARLAPSPKPAAAAGSPGGQETP
jgi:hypothetical protein